VRRLHFDLLFRLCLSPASQYSAAREHKGMRRLVAADDGEFKVAVEWRSRDRLPHGTSTTADWAAPRLDFSQSTAHELRDGR
jgi:hypothetical protein